MKLYLIIFILFYSLCTGIYTKRPHIVFILADDLGWNDVSFRGSLQIPTPNIDVLASNGVVLNNYYVQPLCTPSRAALLSGRHPIQLGLQHWIIYGAQLGGLPLHVKILPQYLKEFGYATHIVGKWHLGFHRKEFLPTYRGFDSHFGFWLAKMDYYDHTSLEIYKNSTLQYAWGDALRDNLRLASELRGKYATHLFTDRAVDIIRQHDTSQPLFLYVSHSAPHTGNKYALLQAPYSEILKFAHIKHPERRIYAAIVSELDKSIGKIFKTLDETNMLDDTIFIVSTDNGGEHGFRGGIGSNWPLRGVKGTLWEGGVRGIGIVWSKLLKNLPRIENGLMHITDWLPTLYHAAGGDVSDLGDIYGLNQWTTLSDGTPSPREEILLNVDPIDGASALRLKNYKILNGSNLNGKYDKWYYPTNDDEVSSIHYQELLRSSDFWNVLQKNGDLYSINNSFSDLKLKCYLSSDSESNCSPSLASCLFDIRNDPCELNNIANTHSEIVQSMLERLQELQSNAVPLINPYIDPLANPALHQFAWTNWLDKE